MKAKLLNLRVTYKLVLSILLVGTIVSFLIARFPEKIAAITNSDAGRIHGMAEKIYTVGMIGILGILGISVVANPLVMGLLVLTGATLIYHLIQKFK
jgi:hypothetical protein